MPFHQILSCHSSSCLLRTAPHHSLPIIIAFFVVCDHRSERYRKLMLRGKEKKSDGYHSETSDQGSYRNNKKKKNNGDVKPRAVTARIVSIDTSNRMNISEEDREQLLANSSEEPVTVVSAQVGRSNRCIAFAFSFTTYVLCAFSL